MATPPAPTAPPRKRTLYDILGVTRECTALDIGLAYKARVTALDRDPHADPNEINLVHEAYRVLCLPNERAAYDAKLVAMAEKAAARESAQHPDLVLEPDPEDAPPWWKHKAVLAGGAAAVLVLGYLLVRSPSRPPPQIVAQRELRPEAAAPAKPAPPPAPVVRSAEDLFADLSRSTARITVYDVAGRAAALGSGVVTGIGTVVTNCHVATAAGGTLSVKVGGEQFSASVEVADEEYDLCKLSVLGLTAPAVPIGSADTLKTGQKVYAIGAPQGLDLTISDGIVSGMRELPQGRVIQTTAPISPGSSGGPLFDAYGRLVGIMTFQHRSGQNLNFAVPADWIANIRARPAEHPLTEAMQRVMAPS